MRYLRIAALGLAFLGWVTACAGTGEMMGKDQMMAKEGTMAKDDMMGKDQAMSTAGMTDNQMGMASEDKGGMGMQKEMHAMLMGSDGHHAAGEVSFGMGMDNAYVLTLSDIQVDKVPDGYVYLARDGDWMHGAQLGMLKQFTGTVSFDLPAGINPDDYDTVVIWCQKFNVEIGRAVYGKKVM